MQKLLPLLFVAMSATGSTIQFTGLPLNTQYGTYNGFAFATVDGKAGQLLICDDFDHTTYIPSGEMEFDPSELTGSGPALRARFVQPGSPNNTLRQYQEAAILLDGLSRTGPGSLLDLTASYQYALWHLFTPSVSLPDGTALTLLEEAERRVAQGSAVDLALYTHLRIYTPSDGFTSNQEFLQLVANPEPSPGILILVGAVAIALSMVLRRTLRQRRGARLGNSPGGSAR